MKKTTKKKQVEVGEMTDDGMADLLIDLVDTAYWVAIKRYYNIRANLAERGLKSVDPFKQPTEVARNQGILIGLNDLEEFIDGSIENRKKKSAEATIDTTSKKS